jgi:hypothetical protein
MAARRRKDEDDKDDRNELHQLRLITGQLKAIHEDVHDNLRNIHCDVHRIVEILEVVPPAPGKTLGAFIAAIHGRSNTMAVVIPVPKLLDTEKVLLSVMPRKADGHVDAGAVVTWASSDPSQVGIEVGVDSFVFTDPQFSEDVTCPGNFNCYALTPNASGAGTVTVGAPGYESAEFSITYEPGVPRSLNASAGGPVSDL